MEKLMRAKAAALLYAVSLGLLFPSAALAVPVTYRWIGTISGAGYGPTPIPDNVGFFLTVTDAAVAAGSMQFTVNAPSAFGMGGHCPSLIAGDCVITGDPTGYLGFGRGLSDFSGNEATAAITGLGWFALGVSFNPDGTLSGSISDHGTNSDIVVSGSEFAWGGTLSSDYSLCDAAIPGGLCTVSGYFLRSDIAVPEPPSLWIFSSGLGAMIGLLTAFRRKRAARVLP